MDDALKSHINRFVVVGAVDMWATGALAVVHISTAHSVRPLAGRSTPGPGCGSSRLGVGGPDCKTGSSAPNLGALRVGEHSRADRPPHI